MFLQKTYLATRRRIDLLIVTNKIKTKSMETKDRTKTEVSIELREVQREISKARSTRNWAKISFLNQKRIRLQEELDYLKSKDKFYYQEQNLEKSLVSWAAKTLNLSLNMADLSVYYLDLYLLHFKERGFVPTDEWKTKEKAFHEATKELAEYMRYFFKGKSSDDNSESMSELMDLIERDYYTDREKVHHKQYEEKL